MRFTLHDIESNKDVKFDDRKKKRLKLIQTPTEAIPYQRKDFMKFVDSSYEHDSE